LGSTDVKNMSAREQAQASGLLDQALDLNLAAGSRVEVLRRLGALAAGVCAEIDATEATAALLARERLGSTVLLPGLALPHARLAGLGSPVLSAVRLAQGVDFDGEMVSLAVGILVPDDDTQMHLEQLRSLAAVLRQPDRVAALCRAESTERFLALMKGS
jgi:PTS system nitrogen regulatory IIA component